MSCMLVGLKAPAGVHQVTERIEELVSPYSFFKLNANGREI